MNKFDIVNILAKEKNLSQKDAEKVVSTIINEITNILYFGERAEFRGFGIFSSKVRDKRVGRNPKTGQSVNIERKKSPQFKLAKNFLEKINK